MININCKYLKDIIYCTNKNVKRSLLGLGARVCREINDRGKCEYKLKHDKPKAPPPPPKNKCNCQGCKISRDPDSGYQPCHNYTVDINNPPKKP